MEKSFKIEGSNFILNGEPFQIHAGEMHPSRIPKEYWEHRIKMVRAIGLNTISIYTFWNIHEPEPGKFSFSGWDDDAEFIKLVQKHGMYAIVRPGPYCCAEWDLGGMPYWLYNLKGNRLRTSDPEYLRYVERYLKAHLAELKDLQIHKGGPILMFQVENEYGSYGRDSEYLRKIKSFYEESGITVPLFTCDGGHRHYLIGGSIPEVLPAINFGSNPKGNFEDLEEFRKDIPHMCSEFYPGWFNHWGDLELVSPRTQRTLDSVKWMVENKKSFNLFVIHGGTNFGWTAGANFFSKYEPTITSYDYGAPIDETGSPNITFHGLRKYFEERASQAGQPALPPIPGPIPRIREDVLIEFSEYKKVFDALPTPIDDVLPGSMEHYGQGYGWIVYRAVIDKSYTGNWCNIQHFRDFAHVFVDGVKIAELSRIKKQDAFKIPKYEKETVTLDILVEPFGRVNYGFGIQNDRKGIDGQVIMGQTRVLMNWQVFLLPFNEEYFSGLNFTQSIDLNTAANFEQNKSYSKGPKIQRAIFSLDEVGDAFLDMRGYRRGLVWINGHNLGRYWDIGPQKCLYVPGVWLNKGKMSFYCWNAWGRETRAIKKGITIANKKSPVFNKDFPPIVLRPKHVK